MIRVLRKIFDQELVVRTSAGLVRGERKLSSLNKEVSETSKLNFINKKGYDVNGMEWEKIMMMWSISVLNSGSHECKISLDCQGGRVGKYSVCGTPSWRS